MRMYWLLAACVAPAMLGEGMKAPAAPKQSIASDPALDYASKLTGPGNPYSHGLSGEGDDRIHYTEAGSGPTVIFIHGFPSFWYVWRDQMEALRHCRRVIAINAPGAGLLAKPVADEAYKVEHLAQRVHRLIEEIASAEKVVLVGHDWGGALAWSCAQWDSSRLDRLAIFSAPSYNLLLDLLANDPEQREVSSYMPRLLRIDRETAATEAFATSFYDLAYKRMIDTQVLDQREGALFRNALACESALYACIQWYKADIPEFDDLDPVQLS